MSNGKLFQISAAMGATLALSVSASRAGVQSDWQHVDVNQSAGLAEFVLNFDHVPDFHRNPADGLPTDSFQIEIDGTGKAGDPAGSQVTTVIRGDEIGPGHTLPVRTATPPDLSDPSAGGWGPKLGDLSFTLSGTQVSFVAPLKLIGATDGQFSYRAFTFEDGVMTNAAEAQPIGLPLAFWSGMVAFTSMGIFVLVQRLPARLVV